MAELKAGTTIGGYKAIHSNNLMTILKGKDGHGSGLDADLLDGHHADYFVKKNGDTMTGALKFVNAAHISTDATTSLQLGYTSSGSAAITSWAAIRIMGNTDKVNSEPIQLVTGEGITTDNAKGLVVWQDRMTFYNNKVWHAGNDGSGSGLDADTVDGIQAERLVYGDNYTGSVNLNNNGVNDIFKSGFYRPSSTNNTSNNPLPDAIHSGIIHIQNPAAEAYAGQIALPYNNNNRIYFRTKSTNWQSWNRIYHTGNKPTPAEIGSVNKAGDTMTGILGTPNNSRGIKLGDDIYLCDRDVANNMVLEGGADATQAGIVFGSGKDTNIYRGGSNLLKTDDTMNAVGGFQWNGQSLDERYFARRGEIGKTTDWNSIVHPGCYKVQQDSWGNASSTHAPCQGYCYGLLMVYRTNVSSEDRLYQVYMPHREDEARWYRMCNNGVWNNWKAQDVRDSADLRYVKGDNIKLSVNDDILNSSKLTTSRKQLIAGSGNTVFVGNSTANMNIEAASTPNINIGGNLYPIYHTGRKPSPSEIGASPSNHTHSYLPLSGGTLTGDLTMLNDNEGINFFDGPRIYKQSGDGLTIRVHTAASGLKIENRDQSLLARIAQDTFQYKGHNIYHAGNKPSYSDVGALKHQSSGALDFNNIKTTGVYSTSASNTNAPTTTHGTLIADFNLGTPYQIWIPDNSFTIYKRNYTPSSGAWGGWSSTIGNSISGNANTASRLQTARTINGTNFDGSGNITTANWGTARNITIGNSTKSVNGSGNVSWNLNEIGVVAISDVSSEYDLNKVVKRDTAGDVKGRLFRANYKDDNYMNGAIAFRSNNTGDNYTRYCNNPIAVNDWLGSLTGRGILDVGVDLNTVTKNGIYEINEISKSGHGISGVYDWGILTVMGTNANRITQVYYPHQWSNGKRIPYMRMKNGNDWTSWTPIYEGINWNDIQGKPGSFSPSSHNHTSLTGITQLSFTAQNTDTAYLKTVVDGLNTYFDSCLSDDPNQEKWRWRFHPSGGSEFSAMELRPINLNTADLVVSGSVFANNNQKVYHPGNQQPYRGYIDERKSNSRSFTIIDLSDASYNRDTFYPVVGTAMPGMGFVEIRISANLNTGTNVPWSNHNSKDITVNFHVLAKACNWGVTSGESIILSNEARWTAGNPVGYSQLENSSTPVLWLRGGGKYPTYNNGSITWTPKKSSYTIMQETVAPTTTNPGFSIKRGTVMADLNGKAESAKSADSVAWNNVSGKPSTFTPSSHNHSANDVGALPDVNGTAASGKALNSGSLEIGTASDKKIVTGVGGSDVYIRNTKPNKYLALKDDGRLVYNNINVTLDDPNTVLWQGYHHMTKSETVKPSKKLSECSRGWILVWSDWNDGGKGENFNFVYSYVPKNTPWKNAHNTCFPLSNGESESSYANKTLYISDDKITGHDNNKDKANAPKSYDIVLRAVLEC